METLVKNIVGSLLRLALGGLVAWLMQKGLLQPDQEAAFYSALTAGVAAIGWAVYRNIVRQKQLTTAAGSPKTTVAAVIAKVAAGESAPVLTPTDEIPKVPAQEKK